MSALVNSVTSCLVRGILLCRQNAALLVRRRRLLKKRWARLPPTPRSADRARSLARVSKKREYFKCRPETIGDFAPKLFKLGGYSWTANSQKAAIGVHFTDFKDDNVELMVFLAVAGTI